VSAHDFAACILQETLKAREVHEGFNFRFGHQAEGNITLLTEFGREMGFSVVEYPEMKLRGELVASSRIRALLREGRVDRARHLLARPFSILSTPAPGRGYGSKQTVPTINLAEYAELIPKNGVYITRTRVADECFDSVTNIGNRPTFGKDSFAIESHLLKFHPVELNQDTEIEIYFLDRIRDERKFPSVEDLRAQIGKDIARAQRYLRRLGAPSFPEKELSK
jgi:riboflavin kinase/FMN adenylyltransferase